MDFNLKALGAETVMVDRRLAARLVEAELLLRDGEKLPYAEELNQFIRQNSFIGVNPSERLFAKCAVTGKNAECIGVMVKPRRDSACRRGLLPTARTGNSRKHSKGILKKIQRRHSCQAFV